jgi:hypothetical protein
MSRSCTIIMYRLLRDATMRGYREAKPQARGLRGPGKRIELGIHCGSYATALS